MKNNVISQLWSSKSMFACPHRDCILKTLYLEQVPPHFKIQHDNHQDE